MAEPEQQEDDRHADDARLPLVIELLGVPRWRAADGRGAVLKHVDALLLAVLAIDGPQPRDTLAGRLWPDASRGQAGNNLRQRVMRLRRETGHALFRTGSALGLLESVQVDAADVEGLGVEALIASGDFLAGLDAGGHDLLVPWLDTQRDRLRHRRADILARHAQAFEARGEWAAALHIALEAIEIVPLYEAAWRRVMQLHYLLGDRAAAIDAFERFERLLKDNGARPSSATAALMATIDAADARPALPCSEVPVALVRPPRLVGRGASWSAMEQAWAAAAAFLLVGEAGIGKTRLLQDFVRGRAGTIVESARPGDARVPYALVGRVLRQLHHQFRLAPDRATRRELARLEGDFGEPLPAPSVEGSVRHAVERLFDQAASAGLRALVVDDLHAADVASLETLRWLGAGPVGAAVRFGFAARPDAEGEVGRLLDDWLASSRRPVRVRLGALTVEDVSELLTSLELQVDRLPDAARLHRHAGGQPLFTLETLKDLHRAAAGPVPMPLPGAVHTLLERRLAALPEDVGELLRIAAVCGAEFSLDRAARLLGCQPVTLAGRWYVLERADVLKGPGFAYDLMRDCALGRVPGPVREHLHAQVAALLEAEGDVAPACIAPHWQAAGRWPKAAQHWSAAGRAARQAGRLDEQAAAFAQAAQAFRNVGDADAAFDAQLGALDGLLVARGGAAVLEALAALRPLARTAAQRLRCGLAEAEALVDLGRAEAALACAAEVAAQASDLPERLPDVLAVHGLALALGGRFDAAVDAARRAGDAARALGDAAQSLRAAHALAYTLYAAGRLGEAIEAQRESLRQADALGDHAEAAASEGNLAALLGVVGDVPASVPHARRVRQRYRDMGVSANSTLGCMNLIVLGVGAAYLGAMGEALDALEEAAALAGQAAGDAIRAKACICLAQHRLTLGLPGPAREAVAELPAHTPPGMRMQAAWVLVQCERQQGRSGEGHQAALARLMTRHADLPLVQSAWIEWSHQGDAAQVLAALAPVYAQCLAHGLAGTARALRLRQVARLLELDDAASIATASAWAAELLPQVAGGLGSKVYAPQAWMLLARAFERGGDGATALACRRSARAWLDRALSTVPELHRDSFCRVNPVNRELLGTAS